MPIEIRELVIRTSIIHEKGKDRGDKNQAPVNEREIIDKCVDKILKKLYKKPER